MRRRKILVTSFLAIILLLAGTYYVLTLQKYSISEINADNYRMLLSSENERSLAGYVPLSEFFKNSEIFLNGINIEKVENWSIARDGSSTGNVISFLSEKDDTYYILTYKDASSNILLNASISSLNMDDLYLPEGKDIIERALKQQGFSYSKSEIKNAPDILIKEFGTMFLIGQVIFDNDNRILGINFQFFKRQKYFN